MIGKFKIEGYKDLTPEQLQRLAPHVRELPTEPKNYWFEYIGDIFAAKAAVPELNLVLIETDLPVRAFEVILERLRQLEDKCSRPAVAPFNDRVNVSVPGLGLLIMDTVEVMTDACTERLQEALDNGWRILAICPQPDQRRPDYILGRTKRDS